MGFFQDIPNLPTHSRGSITSCTNFFHSLQLWDGMNGRNENRQPVIMYSSVFSGLYTSYISLKFCKLSAFCSIPYFHWEMITNNHIWPRCMFMQILSFMERDFSQQLQEIELTNIFLAVLKTFYIQLINSSSLSNGISKISFSLRSSLWNYAINTHQDLVFRCDRTTVKWYAFCI